ncbi:Hypothetical predicted protein [Scomber scombrus]|uniref:Uncharacterized protein n=1 Tax=Scomber scombrus TaxID=13677 RepID=A0AAV1Q4P0_SCOSC
MSRRRGADVREQTSGSRRQGADVGEQTSVSRRQGADVVVPPEGHRNLAFSFDDSGNETSGQQPDVLLCVVGDEHQQVSS